jgi:hypothetical protein
VHESAVRTVVVDEEDGAPVAVAVAAVGAVGDVVGENAVVPAHPAIKIERSVAAANRMRTIMPA